MTLILNNLINSQKFGLAVDIDETLSWTVGSWVRELQESFGNPENLSVQEIIDKYRYTQNVPYWQSDIINNWREEKRNSNEFQKNLPLIPQSNHFLNLIDKIIPVISYLTIRPENVDEGTKYWLDKYNFPKASIISKPDRISFNQGNKWKANVLSSSYPKLRGIIDDNPEIINFLPLDYKGTIFLYSSSKLPTSLDVIICPTWKIIYQEIKNKFL